MAAILLDALLAPVAPQEENYQEFCRLLSRIKPNYQLAELVSVDSYLEWVELCAQFTVDSFINWPPGPPPSIPTGVAVILTVFVVDPAMG